MRPNVPGGGLTGSRSCLLGERVDPPEVHDAEAEGGQHRHEDGELDERRTPLPAAPSRPKGTGRLAGGWGLPNSKKM